MHKQLSSFLFFQGIFLFLFQGGFCFFFSGERLSCFFWAEKKREGGGAGGKGWDTVNDGFRTESG